MSKLLNELLGAKGIDEQKGFVFFTDNGPEGKTNKAEFRGSLIRQKKSDKAFRVKHMKTLFDNMSLGRNILGEPSLVNDNGQQVVWVKFYHGKQRDTLQILNECGMYDFIMEYAAGNISNVPNFETLINSIQED